MLDDVLLVMPKYHEKWVAFVPDQKEAIDFDKDLKVLIHRVSEAMAKEEKEGKKKGKEPTYMYIPKRPGGTFLF